MGLHVIGCTQKLNSYWLKGTEKYIIYANFGLGSGEPFHLKSRDCSLWHCKSTMCTIQRGVDYMEGCSSMITLLCYMYLHFWESLLNH